MSELRMGAIESRFADMIWENEPVPSPELVKLAERNLNWKKSTTYTVLKKMCNKGLLQNEKSLVTVTVPRELVDNQAAEQFVNRTFGGSLPGFLAAFIGGKTLTAQEAEELKHLIDEHKEG